MSFVGEVLSAFNENKMVLSVFIDLRKAFDSTTHNLILRKLDKLGFGENALKWYQSYLSKRMQRVTIAELMSQWTEVKVGIPQGSLLGVLLFQLLINDLPKSLSFCQSILYADDSTIFLVGRSLKFLRTKLQSDLASLSEWLWANQLKLNVSKTKYVLFHEDGLTPHVDLVVNDQSIGRSANFKFLGVTLDPALSFDSHFAELYAKLSKSSFIIRGLGKFVPRECLRYLYFGYYHSHLTYCLPVWWPLLRQSSQLKLEILQKRIVRCICNELPRQHCMPLYKKQKILTISDQVLLENVKWVYRIIYDLCPKLVMRLYSVKVNKLDSGLQVSSNNYCNRACNLSFLCKPIMCWQNLTREMREKNNIKSFVKVVKSSLLIKY